MRLQRYSFILLALYMLFIGGGTYFQLSEIRFFHHIFMTALLALWLIWRLRKGRGLPETALNWPLFALVIAWGVSIILSSDPRMSLEMMWIPVINLGIFWFIANAFQRAQDHLIIETTFLMAATTIFMSAIQIADVWFGLGIVRPTGLGWSQFVGDVPLLWMEDMRLWLPLGVSTWVAGFVAPLIVLTVGWMWQINQRTYRVLLGIFAILLAVVLFLTFSRGGYIAVAAGIGVFVVLRVLGNLRDFRLFTRRNLLIAGSLLAAMLVIFAVVFIISGDRSRVSGDQKRTDLWRSALTMIQSEPLTGVGLGQYGHILREVRRIDLADDRLSSAHNIYLNTAAEIGVVPTIVITIWMTVIILRAWWRRRQADSTTKRERIQLDTMLAVLIAMALHNVFDTLTFTASVALAAVAAVYLIVPPAKSRLEAPPRGNPPAAWVALGIIIAYGLWFVVQVDPAHRSFIASLAGDGLADAQEAAARDPALNLYDLQITHLIGRDAFNEPITENLTDAIAAYERALVLEPTWTTGWVNLGALHEQNDDLDAALTALDEARRYTLVDETIMINRARIAEMSSALSRDDIIAEYILGIRYADNLPLSPFWMETDLRRDALMEYVDIANAEQRYRIAVAHQFEPLSAYVPQAPQTAADFWAIGEHELTINDNVDAAISAFSEAIALAPTNGDYYVARARALRSMDPQAALRDLDRATLYRVRYEYPNAVRAILITDSAEREALLIEALPPRTISQNFEAVLYNGRVGNFVVAPTMQPPGPGDAAMQPWYDLADLYRNAGDDDAARIVYRAIRAYAPYDERAKALLDNLSAAESDS